MAEPQHSAHIERTSTGSYYAWCSGPGCDWRSPTRRVELDIHERAKRHERGPYVPPRERGGGGSKTRRGDASDHSSWFRMISRMVAASAKRVSSADLVDLRELVGIQDTLDEAIRTAITGLRDSGYSWKSLGEALGVSGQAVYMRYGKPKAS